MDLTSLIIVASSVGATFAVLLAFAAGWIASRRLDGDAAAALRLRVAYPDGAAASHIAMADLRERLRRLEAIAAGIDP